MDSDFLSKVVILTKSNISFKNYHELYKPNSIDLIRNTSFNEKFGHDDL
jgi:hypothetical protein